MGVFQKRRFRNFLNYVHDYEQDKPSTHQDLDLTRMTMRDVFTHFKCDMNTITFSGHALALYRDDDYLDDVSQTLVAVEKIKLYAYSLSRYGNSPYIYPMWGLGGLPEGFSRLSAIHGGTYMLNRPIEEILYDDDGKVRGIKSQGEEARCKQLLGDPSYFQESGTVEKTGQVARWLFIMDHPIGNTSNADSCQIIIPSRQTGRKSDIYISMVSDNHQVCAKGKYVAMMSATVETSDPQASLTPYAKELLRGWDKEIFFVSDTYAPTTECMASTNNVFVSTSYDATTHFETATNEVLEIYTRMTGDEVDLTISADPEALEEAQLNP
eukprot:TRINITY_DN341_c0_g1_i1.p1 TRINITY_DN341_c0_g1~~TRINITY_DN341_c0_g1_i1.p1  ORF type:complete len:325 (+),score=64.50 TRINITY_DN341_c0_g1_i1:93-1067(+)